jgi:hypothetical protein
VEEQHTESAVKEAPSNWAATTGFVLGLVSVVFYNVGIIPVLAIVFSGIGLNAASKLSGKGKVLSWIGLVLGIVYLMVNYYYYR